MAARVIKSLPRSGTVSRTKVRAAVKAVKYKVSKSKAPKKAGHLTKKRTASGRKLISFRKASFTSVLA